MATATQTVTTRLPEFQEQYIADLLTSAQNLFKPVEKPKNKSICLVLFNLQFLYNIQNHSIVVLSSRSSVSWPKNPG